MPVVCRTQTQLSELSEVGEAGECRELHVTGSFACCLHHGTLCNTHTHRQMNVQMIKIDLLALD